MNWSGQGGVLGFMLATGIWLILVGVRQRRRPQLQQRLEPYLREIRPSSALLLQQQPASPLVTLQRILGPVASDAVSWLGRLHGGSASIQRRLEQLGNVMTLEAFRAEQVLWGILGAGVGVAFSVLAGVTGGFSVLAAIIFIVIGAALGILGRDQWLTVQVRRREQRILAEFPTVAELLALAVVAGEGAVGALERVSRICHGELSEELRRTVADAHAGASVIVALENLARRTSLPSLARFVDGVVVAVERGTPLADVLRAQAQDVRDVSRRQLMEAGGKKEIGMMVPVVFLVLPITVLFAVFPALSFIELQM